MSVTTAGKHPMWAFSMTDDNILTPFYDYDFLSNRQALPAAYVINGAFYLAGINWLKKKIFCK